MPIDHKRPSVFISSTAEDLNEFREAAKETLIRNGCFPVMFEYWEGADNPPLPECLTRVDACDLLLAVVAKRHGWTPTDQTGGEGKSITRLECERALTKGIDIIPFLLGEKAAWSVENTEEYRLTVAAQQGETDGIADLSKEIEHNKSALTVFKAWLSDGRQRRLFSTPDELRLEITNAVNRWRRDHPEFQLTHAVASFDRVAYRDWQRRRCESVELLGLDQHDAHNVRLQHVYVPAVVTWNDPPPVELQARVSQGFEDEPRERASIDVPLARPDHSQRQCAAAPDPCPGGP